MLVLLRLVGMVPDSVVEVGRVEPFREPARGSEKGSALAVDGVAYGGDTN